LHRMNFRRLGEMTLRNMKLRDRRGWTVRRHKGQPVRNTIRALRKTCILNTLRFRHL